MPSKTSFGSSVTIVGCLKHSLLQVHKTSKKVEKHDQFFFQKQIMCTAPSFNFFCCMHAQFIWYGITFNKLHFGTKMKFQPCMVTKLHIWQLLEAILFFFHNLVTMLAEINEHAYIKHAESSI